MRRRRSRFAEVACVAAVALASSSAPRTVRAQACCVAPSTTGLGRLASAESALAGAEARASVGYGSFESNGRYRGAPSGAHDVAVEQNLFASGRWLSRGQATLTVPFVETLRGASGSSSAGGGVGDVRLGARWDAVHADEVHPWPGVAILAGVILPTGVAPERATDAFGTDATGTGTTQAWGGFALEEVWGPWLLAMTSTITARAEREVEGVTSMLAPRLSVGLVSGHAWQSGFVLSAGASYALEGDASLDGRTVPGTNRRVLLATLAAQIPLGRAARLVSSVLVVPPAPDVSAGEAASAGGSLAFVVPWR